MKNAERITPGHKRASVNERLTRRLEMRLHSLSFGQIPARATVLLALILLVLTGCDGGGGGGGPY